MTILTLIPESYLYQKAILVTSSLGCSNMASHLHSRWFANGVINPVRIHWLVKVSIVFLGAYVVNFLSLIQVHFWRDIFCIIPAVIAGIVAVKIELIISRKIFRNSLSMPNQYKSNQYIYKKAVINKTQGLMRSAIITKVNLKNIQEHYAQLDSNLNHYRLFDIVMVAISEEIIYRGLLYQLAMQLTSPFAIAFSLFATVILFGASHITLGKGQFLSKTILGSICLVSVWITQSVLSAIIIHVVFNIYAYKEMIKLRGKC